MSNPGIPRKEHTTTLTLSPPAEVFFRMNRIEQRIAALAMQLQRREPSRPLGAEHWKKAEKMLVSEGELSVHSQGHRLVMKLQMRGFEPGDVQVHIEGDILCIIAEHATQEDTPAVLDGAAHQHSSSVLFRKLPLPKALNRKNLSMWASHGELTLSFPLEMSEIQSSERHFLSPVLDRHAPSGMVMPPLGTAAATIPHMAVSR